MTGVSCGRAARAAPATARSEAHHCTSGKVRRGALIVRDDVAEEVARSSAGFSRTASRSAYAHRRLRRRRLHLDRGRHTSAFNCRAGTGSPMAHHRTAWRSTSCRSTVERRGVVGLDRGEVVAVVGVDGRDPANREAVLEEPAEDLRRLLGDVVADDQRAAANLPREVPVAEPQNAQSLERHGAARPPGHPGHRGLLVGGQPPDVEVVLRPRRLRRRRRRWRGRLGGARGPRRRRRGGRRLCRRPSASSAHPPSATSRAAAASSPRAHGHGVVTRNLSMSDRKIAAT